MYIIHIGETKVIYLIHTNYLGKGKPPLPSTDILSSITFTGLDEQIW